MEIKEYQVDYWDGEDWIVSGSFDTKKGAEEELNELLKTYGPADVRVIGYLTGVDKTSDCRTSMEEQ